MLKVKVNLRKEIISLKIVLHLPQILEAIIMRITDIKIQFLYFATVWLKRKQLSAYKEHLSQVLPFQFVLSVVLKYNVCNTMLNQQIVIATLYIPY